MRDIKFRMWDEDEQVMIDGDNLAFEEYAPIADLLTQKGIMQYTGLKDKNGVEIYEGDILGGFWHCYVRYCNRCKSFEVFAHGYGCYSCMGDLDWQDVVNDEENLEVIGNIYENPELLVRKPNAR